jgi:TPR repeat protein
MKRLILLLVALMTLVSGVFVTARATRIHQEEEVRKEALSREMAALRQQAEAGSVASQLALADRLRAGKGMPSDPAMAIAWYRKAAQQGSAAAAAALGAMYETGGGVAQDYLRAADWYRIAVSFGGPAQAYYALGRMHLYGRGVLHDPIEAFALVRTAAERGEAAAQYLLAMMYDEGWGTDREPVEAYKWFLLAAQRAPQGEAGAKGDTARLRLARRLNSQQLREAEKRANQWAAKW